MANNPRVRDNLRVGGKPGNKGGGRPTDEFRKKCRDIFEKAKLCDFVADVAKGVDFEQRVNEDGEVVKIPASIKDRLAATKMLKEWGHGGDPQGIEITGKDGEELKSAVVVLPAQSLGQQGGIGD